MVFVIVLGALVVLALAGGWWIDHRAARRGYRVDVRHAGLRRQVSVTRIDDGTEPPLPRRGGRERPGEPR